MADKPSGSTPPKRKPSFRRGVVIDVTQGKVRVRKWPRARGKAKTKADQKRQDEFRIAQRASRYFAPQIMVEIEKATAGTPLLPRDLTTMMLFNRMYCFLMPNGKVLWPMPAKVNVSESLDAISQRPGDTLIRTPNGWEGAPAAAAGGLTKIADEQITPDAPEWVSPPLNALSAVIVQGIGVRLNTSVQRAIQLSTDGGLTYHQTVGDYQRTTATGEVGGSRAIFPHEGASADPRDFLAIVIALRSPGPKPYLEMTRGRVGYCGAANTPVDRLRLIPSTASEQVGRFLAGRVIIWGL